MRTIKNLLRPARDFLYCAGNYLYDLYRFSRYGGWNPNQKQNNRDYKAVKTYHRLEKSLSFRDRDPRSGWGVALELKDFLLNREISAPIGFHESIGHNVLAEFIKGNSDNKNYQVIDSYLSSSSVPISRIGGAPAISRDSLLAGVLEDPESFFMSRASVRDFSNADVNISDVERALNLALKTPSVCNRQAWHIYLVSDRKKIDSVLAHQNGNRGFGHFVPLLALITADLTAFDIAGERNQPYIDGGMFAMSLILALHSIGLGSCCLNWSKGGLDDIKLRKTAEISPSHLLVTMLAIGHPSETLKICYSARRPISEIVTHL